MPRGRRKREWLFSDKPMPRPRCPKCHAGVCIFEWAKEGIWYAECAPCGRDWRKDEMGDYRIEKTKDGTECWVTADLSVVDRFAPLLASMMPIIRDDQWAIIGPLPAEQQATFVRANLKMWDEERELRLQDKARTVHGPTGFAGGEV